MAKTLASISSPLLMRIVSLLLAGFLLTASQSSLAAGYKVQIYNGTGKTIYTKAWVEVDIKNVVEPYINFEFKCKWANTNYNLANYKNWSDSTSNQWWVSIHEKRSIAQGKHRTLWCWDKAFEKRPRAFEIVLYCNGLENQPYKRYFPTDSKYFDKGHLGRQGKYVLSLDSSSCLPG